MTESAEAPAKFETGSPEQLDYLGRLHRPIRGADPGNLICAQQCRIEHGRDRGSVQLYPCKTAQALGLTAPTLPNHVVLGRSYPVTSQSGPFSTHRDSQITVTFTGEDDTPSSCTVTVRFQMDDDGPWAIELKDNIWGLVSFFRGERTITFIFGRPRQ
jgi:hypothetical protein